MYACSDDHLHEFVSDMKSHFDDQQHVHKDEAEHVHCPMCGMDGDAHNALDFKGDQAIFLCAMENEDSKNKFLTNPKDYISKMSTTGPAAAQNSTAGSSRSVTEAYCSGRTVMYMSSGFTWEDTTCLVFMFESLVIDSRSKLWLAALATFALGVFHEWLMSLRRKLVYKQREARTRGTPFGDKSERVPLLSGNHASALKEVPTRVLDIGVALLYGCSLTIGYVAMLAVMTYHTLLLVAAVAGFSTGQYMYKDCDAPRFEGDMVEVGAEPCCGG